jgi:hypothetical protein
MDLIINKRQIAVGMPYEYTEIKITSRTGKGRFVVDYFNGRDAKPIWSNIKTAEIGKEDMEVLFKLIKLAGELDCYGERGFQYEVREESDFR